jgi:hypothetical protein
MVASMTHAVVTDVGDHHTATIPVGNDTGRKPKRMGILGTLSVTPGFAYILALFVIGALVLPDPRATLIEIGPFKLSWVEVIIVGIPFNWLLGGTRTALRQSSSAIMPPAGWNAEDAKIVEETIKRREVFFCAVGHRGRPAADPLAIDQLANNEAPARVAGAEIV